MKIRELRFTGFIILAALVFAAGCSENKQAQSQDTVYINGFIYTVNPGQATAEALAVKDGVIIAVGSNEEVQALVSDQTRVVDLNGRMLMPGIHDMHAHPKEAGEKYNQCAFPFTFTMDEIVAKLTACAADTSKGEWIRGGQRFMELSDTVPNKKILDAITKEHPIYLGDVHGAWLNSRALEVLGIDESTPDPAGGLILREPESMEPTGILIDNA